MGCVKYLDGLFSFFNAVYAITMSMILLTCSTTYPHNNFAYDGLRFTAVGVVPATSSITLFSGCYNGCAGERLPFIWHVINIVGYTFLLAAGCEGLTDPQIYRTCAPTLNACIPPLVLEIVLVIVFRVIPSLRKSDSYGSCELPRPNFDFRFHPGTYLGLQSLAHLFLGMGQITLGIICFVLLPDPWQDNAVTLVLQLVSGVLGLIYNVTKTALYCCKCEKMFDHVPQRNLRLSIPLPSDSCCAFWFKIIFLAMPLFGTGVAIYNVILITGYTPSQELIMFSVMAALNLLTFELIIIEFIVFTSCRSGMENKGDTPLPIGTTSGEMTLRKNALVAIKELDSGRLAELITENPGLVEERSMEHGGRNLIEETILRSTSFPLAEKYFVHRGKSGNNTRAMSSDMPHPVADPSPATIRDNLPFVEKTASLKIFRQLLSAVGDRADFLVTLSKNEFDSQFTPLHYASMAGNSKIFLDLIRRGANIGTPDCHGRTALVLAAMYGNGHLIATLEESMLATIVNAPCAFGETALHAAVYSGHIATLKALLNKFRDKLNLNARDNGGKTALLLAVERNQHTMVRLLLANADRQRINVNEADFVNKTTALILACRMAYVQCLSALLESSFLDVFDYNHRDGVGKRAFDYVCAWQAINSLTFPASLVTSVEQRSQHVYNVVGLPRTRKSNMQQ